MAVGLGLRKLCVGERKEGRQRGRGKVGEERRLDLDLELGGMT